MTDFVVSAVQDAAQRAIEQAEVIRLSLADQECFAQALLSPPQPAPALERAFARRRKLLARDFNQTVIERVGREPASVSGASSRQSYDLACGMHHHL